MADGYTKLFSDIVDSSIWDENPETCKVWVTLLALSNADGLVRGSVGWLAAKARVPVRSCELALKKFEAPDPQSRTPDNDGRRIERMDDGWLILNYLIFRDRLSMNPVAVKTRERVRKHRERYNALRNVTSVTPVHSASASASESVSVLPKGDARGKERKRPQEPIPIPESLNTPEFLKAWAEWNQHRVEKKKPQTNLSCQKQLKFLESIGTQRAIAAINYSIEKGWEGIYESKENATPANGNGKGDFWKLTKELELVEKEITAISGRASQTSTDRIIQDKDKPVWDRLRKRRSELKSQLQLR